MKQWKRRHCTKHRDVVWKMCCEIALYEMVKKISSAATCISAQFNMCLWCTLYCSAFIISWERFGGELHAADNDSHVATWQCIYIPLASFQTFVLSVHWGAHIIVLAFWLYGARAAHFKNLLRPTEKLLRYA